MVGTTKKGIKIEVDIYLHNEAMYLIEVKSYADVDDVEWFHSKASIVEKILSRRADKLILVTVNIDREALDRAKELGIEVVYGNVIES